MFALVPNSKKLPTLHNPRRNYFFVRRVFFKLRFYEFYDTVVRAEVAKSKRSRILLRSIGH